jgi:hypothetical protein
MNKSQLRQLIKESIKGLINEQGAQFCDKSTNSFCATNWFGSNVTNFDVWMRTFFNNVPKQNSNPGQCPYLVAFNNFSYSANYLMQTAPNPQMIQGNTLSNWDDIKNVANSAWGVGPAMGTGWLTNINVKNKFKMKMARAKYSQCMSDTSICCPF